MKKLTKRDFLFFLIGALVMFLIGLAINHYNESRTIKGQFKDGLKGLKRDLKR
jgi:hypothetical protein